MPWSPFWTEEERREREKTMSIRPDVIGKVRTTLNIRGDMDFGGVDMTLRLWYVFEAPFTIEEEGFVHNSHQYMVFASSDPDDPDNLGGEAEMSFGEEGYKYPIDRTTVVHVPPGVIHCPLTFTRLDRPMLWLEIFTSSKYLRTAVYDIAGKTAKKTATSSKYAKHIKSAPFFTKKEIGEMKRKSAGSKANIPLARVQGVKDFGGVDISLAVSYIREPFTLVPKTHAHNFHEYLAFMGSDPQDKDTLGGEAEIYYGEEKEKHIINKPQAVHIAPGLVYCPLKFIKIDKPMVYIEIFTTPFYATTAEYD